MAGKTLLLSRRISLGYSFVCAWPFRKTGTHFSGPCAKHNASMIADRQAFIRANTRLTPVPHVPEISLYVADESVPMWEKTEEELGAIGLPPPYWAFAWAGGQALARHVLDHRDIVAGKRVLDLAAGSGLVAIAAAKAGAAPVIAADIDAFTEAAISLNAEANDVYVEIITQDLLDRPAADTPRYDVILVGDLFYERDTADRALAFLA